VTDNREWSDLAERTEMVAMRRIVDDQTPAVQAQLAMRTHDVADGVHTVVVKDPMWGYWNKALGFCDPVTEAVVDDVVQRTRSLGAGSVGLLLQPRVVPESWTEIAGRLGLTAGTTYVKCFGRAEPREVETDLTVTRLTADHAVAFVDVMAAGFGFDITPEAQAMFDGGQFFDGDWATYGAWDGDSLVATARMLCVEETSSVALFGAATRPEGRGRGGQAALLDARIREARDRGLRYASAETWLESPDQPNPSQHNLRRAGLTEVHARPVWAWAAARG
jgi:GNAT superfamily N-acetyltransferase